MQSKRPDWLILVIIILVIGYKVFSRYLKHRERQNEENTKKFNKAMDSFTEIKKGEGETVKVQSLTPYLSGKQESGNVIEGKFDESNRWQKELHELATDFVSAELRDIFSGNTTPVCESEKKRQIQFRKKEKEHIDSEIT